MPSPLIKAIIILFVGIAAFDVMSVLVRMLGGSYPILQISILRNIFGIIPALMLLMAGSGLRSIKKLNQRKQWIIITIRSVAVLLAQMCFYTALTKIEFATTSALGFTSPFFITLLSIPILGHHVGLIRFIAILIGFAGVLTIWKPFDESFTWWMVFPVIAALGYALSSVLVRLFDDETPSAAIQISQQFITFFIGLILLLIFEEIAPIANVKDAGLFVLLGMFGGIGVLGLVIAYRLVDPSSLAPFEYFGIPISFMLGWLFFSEAPFDTLFPGVFFIVGAGLLIFIRERYNKKSNSA